MLISLIVAHDHNLQIGLNNELLWHLPDDFKHFKQTTLGHAVVMGRKTYEALGKPLPHRPNVVITRNPHFPLPDGVVRQGSLESALEWCRAHGEKEAFVIGGGQIYAEALPLADRLYITIVDAYLQGDTVFPKIQSSDWEILEKRHHPQDERHQYAFDIIIYERKKS